MAGEQARDVEIHVAAACDVIVITAPVPGAYPSVNATGRDGFRGGRKTPEYLALFDAVREAAGREMERVGWICAEYLCATTVTFYHTDKRQRDCSNLAKCELDALTTARVWLDDSLARPVTLETEYDPKGPARVVIIVRRKFPTHIAQVSPLLAKARGTRATPAPVVSEPAAVVATPGRIAWRNGVAIPREQALCEIRGGKSG